MKRLRLADIRTCDVEELFSVTTSRVVSLQVDTRRGEQREDTQQTKASWLK